MIFLILSFIVAATYAASGSVCTGLDDVPVIDTTKNVIPFASDYGKTAFELPGCVVQPVNLEQVQHTIKFARLRGLTVSARGNGHSTGGQVLGANNIIIDTSKLNTVTIDAAKRTAVVGAGARWIQLIAAAFAANLRPAAFVDTISETTFGGIFSVGGTSAMTLKTGLAIDEALLSFDCVDGRGNVHHGVSKEHNRDLWIAYRGGLGQFCVATQFVVRLVPLVAVPKLLPPSATQIDIAAPADANVIMYSRIFLNSVAATSFLLGISTVTTVDGVELQAFKNSQSLLTTINANLAFAINAIRLATPGSPSQAAFEAAIPTVYVAFVYDVAPLDDASITAALPAAPAALPFAPKTSMSFLQYASRSVATITAAAQNQAWVSPKILRSLFVPLDAKLTAFVSSVVTLLETPTFHDSFPACQMNFKLVNPALVSKQSLFRIPRTASLDVSFEVSCLDDLTRTGDVAASVVATRPISDPIARAVALGADIDAALKNAVTVWGAKNVKAYPVDAPFQCWASHFDEVWKFVLPLKEKFDPCAILARGVGIFPQSPTRTCTDIRGPFKCSFDGEKDFSDSIDSDQSADLKIYEFVQD